MKKYAGFRNGYVRVRIYGEQTERFLNLCRAHEIRISDLRRESELSLTGCLQIRDFFRLAPIHRKTKVKIHILEKHGLPFFFYRSKKRKAFFLGLLLCAGLLLFLSGRLWEIDVEGNVRNSTPEILDFLEQQILMVIYMNLRILIMAGLKVHTHRQVISMVYLTKLL